MHHPVGPEGRPTILGTGPLQFRCVEPFRQWHVSFQGTALEITAQDLIGFPIVQQSRVRYVWDGEETFGMMERCSTPDRFKE